MPDRLKRVSASCQRRRVLQSSVIAIRYYQHYIATIAAFTHPAVPEQNAADTL